MPESFIRRLRLDGFLSFAPESEAVNLNPLNVVIGPNGAGKSNLIEALALIHATSTDFASAIRAGGGAEDWLWRGERPEGAAPSGNGLFLESPEEYRANQTLAMEAHTLRRAASGL